MKICQLAAVDFGIYRFLLPLMTALKNQGHEVVGVCAQGPRVKDIEAQGFRVEKIDFSRSYAIFKHMRAYKQAVALFRQEQFDIVHVHSPIAALIGRLAAARAGVPRIVYTAHGFYFHERQRWFIRFLFIALEWFAGRFTHVLFTQSEEDAHAAKRYNLCPHGKILAIGNGVDPDHFYPPENRDDTIRRLRATFGAGDEDVVIVMVGRLVAEKGYRELFTAMEKLDAHLWVIGSRLESDHAAGFTDAIRSIKADPERAARIRFLGDREDVDELMRAADIFTLPSHREGMPRSVIEAMMSRLPVVATNIRGSREEVVDGRTGYLVPVQSPHRLHEALKELIENASLREYMGCEGYKRAIELYDENVVVYRQLQALGLSEPQNP